MGLSTEERLMELLYMVVFHQQPVVELVQLVLVQPEVALVQPVVVVVNLLQSM